MVGFCGYDSNEISSAPWVSLLRGFRIAMTKIPKIVQNIAIPVKIVNSPNSDADSPKSPATLLPSPVAAN